MTDMAERSHNMTWKKARESDEHESVLICKATYHTEIASAIRELIERMEADYLALGLPKEEAIFIDINATNGHLMFTWDKKGGGACFYDENWPILYLELKELWRQSLDHEEGAGHFDQQVHVAICTVVGDMLIEAEETNAEERYEFYELFEGSTNGSQRVLV
jgi:hypothetical protein